MRRVVKPATPCSASVATATSTTFSRSSGVRCFALGTRAAYGGTTFRSAGSAPPRAGAVDGVVTPPGRQPVAVDQQPDVELDEAVALALPLAGDRGPGLEGGGVGRGRVVGGQPLGVG